MVDKSEKRTAVQERPTNGPSTPATMRSGGEIQETRGTPATGPFAFMRRFAEDMDHLFEDFGFHHEMSMPRLLSRGHEWLRRETGMTPADWTPRVDVKEKDGKYIVRADLPGIPKESIKIDVKDGYLVIQGERSQESKQEREGYYYSECSYGSFARTIPVPEGADLAKAEANFEDGVLEITMPVAKAAEQTRHRIPIR